MRVLIAGGGVAGLTLAYWLRRYAIDSLVIEQAADLRRDGYAIDFFGSGYVVAQRMGLIPRLESQQVPLDAISYVNRAGRPVVTIDRTLLQRITRGEYFALMHATLEETLYDALGGEIEVRFGRSLASIHAGAEAVDVTFDDGKDASFDLLVGADGVHSLTRKLIFGPEETFSRFLGYMVACYPLPDCYGIGHR